MSDHDLPADTLLGVEVERFDFTKGIPDRFRAVEILFERHPEWIGRFVLLQVAAPSRSKLAAYQDILKESAAVAEQINSRFAGDIDTGKAILRDCIKATIGFEKLGEATGTQPAKAGRRRTAGDGGTGQELPVAWACTLVYTLLKR